MNNVLITFLICATIVFIFWKSNIFNRPKEITKTEVIHNYQQPKTQYYPNFWNDWFYRRRLLDTQNSGNVNQNVNINNIPAPVPAPAPAQSP